MKKHFLTNKYFFKGKAFDLIERCLGKKSYFKRNPTLEKFGTITWLKKQNEKDLTSVGFSTYKGKKVVIKYINFFFKNSIYEQLVNEANILILFSDLIKKGKKKMKIAFPNVFELKENSEEALLITEFIEGETFHEKSSEFKIRTLKAVLHLFKEMSSKIDKSTYKLLPKRSSLQILLTFPFYLAKVTINDVSNIEEYGKFLQLFIKNYISPDIFSTQYKLAHRDLHSKNIIVKNKAITIIDPEVSVLADPQTDIALVAKFYANELSKNELVTFLNEVLSTRIEKKRFISLTIYYAIQMMAIRSNNNPDYKDAKNYLFQHFDAIYKSLAGQEEKTFGELIYFLSLDLLALVTTFFQGKTASFVLCYHSISDDNWRFSTSKKDFISHIESLLKNKKLVSLDELIKKKQNSFDSNVAITLDDGYRDWLRLLPYFKKNKIKGTIFVLGTPANADRHGLNNTKKLMSTNEIKRFIKIGWEIGFHTSTHAHLNKLTDRQLREEIVDGKKALEKNLGIKLRYFAYPYGEYSNRVIAMVKKAGFEAAFTTDGGEFICNNRFALSRICLEGEITMKQFETLISPIGLAFNRAFFLLIKIKHKISTSFMSHSKNMIGAIGKKIEYVYDK